MTTQDQTIAEIIGCFETAESEGLSEALADTQDARLKDLVERRLMHAMYAAQKAAPARCPHCDETGNVHSIDGEWRGPCNCGAQQDHIADANKKYTLVPVKMLLEDADLKFLHGLSQPGDDGEFSTIALHVGDGHTGYGLYASLDEYPEEGADIICKFDRSEAQQDQPAQEPVMYQYRWLNPGDNPDQPESELEWKLVEVRNVYTDTIANRIDELRGYRFSGKPVYEVRPLYAAPPTQPALSEAGIERACEAVAAALGDAYDCGRVWSAWRIGTMSEDDFSLVSEYQDRVREIAVAAIEAHCRARP